MIVSVNEYTVAVSWNIADYVCRFYDKHLKIKMVVRVLLTKYVLFIL